MNESAPLFVGWRRAFDVALGSERKTAPVRRRPRNMRSYFTDDEVAGLDPQFVRRLNRARHRAGVPFIITSGRRTKARNASLGGAKRSSHLTGHGVDIRARSGRARFAIVRGLILAGFTRIGVYNGHVHVDDDPRLPEPTLWAGKSK